MRSTWAGACYRGAVEFSVMARARESEPGFRPVGRRAATTRTARQSAVLQDGGPDNGAASQGRTELATASTQAGSTQRLVI